MGRSRDSISNTGNGWDLGNLGWPGGINFRMTRCTHADYCMTGRAIQGNIQFEGGSIGTTAGRT